MIEENGGNIAARGNLCHKNCNAGGTVNPLEQHSMKFGTNWICAESNVIIGGISCKRNENYLEYADILTIFIGGYRTHKKPPQKTKTVNQRGQQNTVFKHLIEHLVESACSESLLEFILQRVQFDSTQV